MDKPVSYVNSHRGVARMSGPELLGGRRGTDSTVPPS